MPDAPAPPGRPGPTSPTQPLAIALHRCPVALWQASAQQTPRLTAVGAGAGVSCADWVAAGRSDLEVEHMRPTAAAPPRVRMAGRPHWRRRWACASATARTAGRPSAACASGALPCRSWWPPGSTRGRRKPTSGGSAARPCASRSLSLRRTPGPPRGNAGRHGRGGAAASAGAEAVSNRSSSERKAKPCAFRPSTVAGSSARERPRRSNRTTQTTQTVSPVRA